MSKIHPTAVIADGAQIGDDVIIEPYAVIDDDVVIGDGCIIHASVRLYGGTRLGRNVKVFASASIGAEPQDLKFGGERSEISIGENTVIREFASLHRGTGEGGHTKVGRNCLIMAYAHIAHDCVVGDNVILANSVNLAGHVEVDDFAIIGGVVPVHQFVRIGKHVMVGGGFRIPKDIPPFILAAGYPVIYSGLNAVGLRRRGFSRSDLDAIKAAYHALFRSSMNVSQAIEHVEATMSGSEHVREIIDFVKQSKRGLLPGRGQGASAGVDS